MDTSQIQLMVDEHAFLGMNHQEIKAHLIESHGIPKDTKIPPISRKALRDKELFHSTGKIPKWVRGVISTDGPKEPPIGAEKLPENYLRDGIASGRIIHTDYSKTEEESDAIKSLYRDDFPTSLDRWFYGYLDSICHKTDEFKQFKSIVARFGCIPKNASKYQTTEGFLKVLNQHTNEGSVAELFLNERLSVHVDPIFISNWFMGQKTYNIQIDSLTAHELLVSDQASRRNDWMAYAKASPVYIDITTRHKGQRYISGIASIPLSNGSIRYMAIVEWKGVDFQGIIQWEDENLADDATIISLYGDSVYDEAVTDREYGEVAVIALRLYKSALNLRKIEVLTQSARVPSTQPDAKSNPKKKRKSRALSIFNFGVLHIQSGSSVQSSSLNDEGVWSLNQIIGVKGHFRSQYYGSGNRYKKIIWINPYTKGSGEVESKLDKDIMERIAKLA